MSRDERDAMREGEGRSRRERDDREGGRNERRERDKDGRREIKEESRDSRSDRRDEASSERNRREGKRDERSERDDRREESRSQIEIKDEPGEPSKFRPRHTSRSDSEATNSQRGSSPPPERPTSLKDRLMAISSHSEDKESRGKWLKEKIEDHFSKHGIDESAPPTEEEIKMQLKLPSKEAIEKNEFKEPLTNWQTVENTGIPGWNKELLPEEEIVRPPDWKPPTPPRVDIRLVTYVDEFKKEEPELPKITDIFTSKEEILRKDIKDDDEVVLYNSECIIRTTKAGIKKSKRDREDEEAEEDKEV